MNLPLIPLDPEQPGVLVYKSPPMHQAIGVRAKAASYQLTCNKPALDVQQWKEIGE
jgi:hypothetical protein